MIRKKIFIYIKTCLKKTKETFFKRLIWTITIKSLCQHWLILFRKRHQSSADFSLLFYGLVVDLIQILKQAKAFLAILARYGLVVTFVCYVPRFWVNLGLMRVDVLCWLVLAWLLVRGLIPLVLINIHNDVLVIGTQVLDEILHSLREGIKIELELLFFDFVDQWKHNPEQFLWELIDIHLQGGDQSVSIAVQEIEYGPDLADSDLLDDAVGIQWDFPPLRIQFLLLLLLQVLEHRLFLEPLLIQISPDICVLSFGLVGRVLVNLRVK